jgi:hypothetical protein
MPYNEIDRVELHGQLQGRGVSFFVRPIITAFSFVFRNRRRSSRGGLYLKWRRPAICALETSITSTRRSFVRCVFLGGRRRQFILRIHKNEQVPVPVPAAAVLQEVIYGIGSLWMWYVFSAHSTPHRKESSRSLRIVFFLSELLHFTMMATGNFMSCD